MRHPLIISLAIIGLVSPALADTTFVGGEIEGGVWDLEGSPYIIEETVQIAEGDTLIIEPGVWVLFEPFTGLSGHNVTMIAEGTAEDSIWFVPTDSILGWRCLSLPGGVASQRFDYCNFYGAFGWWDDQGAIDNAYSLEIRHSTFIMVGTGIIPIGEAIIEYCLFDSTILYGGIVSASDDSVFVTHCMFRNSDSGVNLYENSVVTNSIFLNISVPFGGPIGEVSYNCFYNYSGLFDFNPMPGVGIIDRTNPNGDSTDAYGNLLMDPLLAGGETWLDRYFLTAESPCIDAGDPEGELDPDGTISDIGPFYFHQNAVSGSDFILHPSSLILSVSPNPFNSRTVLDYFVPSPSPVTLVIYDAQGRACCRLIQAYQPRGTYKFGFDASGWGAGSYFGILETNAGQQAVVLNLVK